MNRKEQIRQAAELFDIKIISNLWTLFERGAEWADAHPDIDVRTMAAWKSGYQAAIDAHPRWISVKEDDALPKEGEMVLAYRPDDTFQFFTTFFTTIDVWKKLGITHWMPLQLPSASGKPTNCMIKEGGDQ